MHCYTRHHISSLTKPIYKSGFVMLVWFDCWKWMLMDWPRCNLVNSLALRPLSLWNYKVETLAMVSSISHFNQVCLHLWMIRIPPFATLQCTSCAGWYPVHMTSPCNIKFKATIKPVKCMYCSLAKKNPWVVHITLCSDKGVGRYL